MWKNPYLLLGCAVVEKQQCPVDITGRRPINCYLFQKLGPQNSSSIRAPKMQIRHRSTVVTISLLVTCFIARAHFTQDLPQLSAEFNNFRNFRYVYQTQQSCDQRPYKQRALIFQQRQGQRSYYSKAIAPLVAPLVF